MARPTPPPRQRGREFVTLIISFLLAFSLGSSVLKVLDVTAFVGKAIVFVLLYIVFYVLLWRLTERIWRGGAPR